MIQLLYVYFFCAKKSLSKLLLPFILSVKSGLSSILLLHLPWRSAHCRSIKKFPYKPSAKYLYFRHCNLITKSCECDVGYEPDWARHLCLKKFKTEYPQPTTMPIPTLRTMATTRIPAEIPTTRTRFHNAIYNTVLNSTTRGKRQIGSTICINPYFTRA